MQKITVILVSCLLVLGCQQMDSSEKQHDEDNGFGIEQGIEFFRASAPPPPPEEEPTLPKASMIIKSGYMKFEVNQLEKAKLGIDSILGDCDGYYENEQYTSYGNRISYTLVLRIPNEKFDSLAFVLEQGVGVLKEKNINAKDVTEEFVDLKIRLGNNMAYLEQYREILKMAKSVKDVLEVKEKIRYIEEQIESKKGRMKFLTDQVKSSTLNLEISELIVRELADKPSFTRKLGNAFNNGIQGLLSFIIGLVNMWPFLIVVGFIFMLRKPLLKRVKNKIGSRNS